MTVTSVLTTFALLLTVGLTQSKPDGAYKILLDGKPVGQERFQAARSDGLTRITSVGEVPVEGSSQKLSTMTEVRNGRISRYTLEFSKSTGIEKYDFSFNGGNAHLTVEAYGRKTERTKNVSEGATLLDKNVWHHYRFLLSQYDLRRGGSQRFDVFIPQAAFRQYTAEVEMKKQVSYEFRDKKIQAYRFEILLADTYDVIVITDEAKTPLSIEIPSEKIKAILE